MRLIRTLYFAKETSQTQANQWATGFVFVFISKMKISFRFVLSLSCFLFLYSCSGHNCNWSFFNWCFSFEALITKDAIMKEKEDNVERLNQEIVFDVILQRKAKH
jgi:hypothetical protein